MMKIKFKALTAVACTALCALSLTACNTGKCTQLGTPASPTHLSYSERTDGYQQFVNKAEKFASDFAYYAYDSYSEEDNFAVSPVSVFMALSLAAECAAGQTRNEILDALGVSYKELTENFSLFFRSLANENVEDGKLTSALIPTNSIWVNEGTPVNTSCIDALSSNYYCYSYSADFKNDNANANKAVQNFVKEQTKGLIDKDFELSDDTLFTLINTLYLKTIWRNGGDDLAFTPAKYDFENKNGTVTPQNLLQGSYRMGRVYRDESFSSFYTATYNDYKIKFIVPEDGYTVDDVFTSENLLKVNNAEYQKVDSQEKINYYTRCLFPEYKCSYDGDICAILNYKIGIERFFKDPGIYSDACDFSTLSTEQCFCANVKHVTDLTVDKTGIEGAAVTVIEMDGAAAPGPDEYRDVYEDFVVDKAFGFIITDSYGVTLFSGVVNAV